VSTSFNYTGRVDMDASLLTANLTETAGKFSVDTSWNFEIYKFPSKAQLQVIFEGVFEKRTFAVGDIDKGSSSQVFDISDMRKPLEAKVTIKIVSKDLSGVPLLIGSLTRFQPLIEGIGNSGKSLLETICDTDLVVPWQLRTNSGRPVLHISNPEGHYGDLHNNALFDPLVIPAVLLGVFDWLMWASEEDRNSDIVEKWQEFFLEWGVDQDLFNKYAGETAPNWEVRSEVAEQANLAVSEFSKEFKLFSAMAKYFEELAK
jgi:hypothetical protein